LATMEVSGNINDILENGENQNDSNFYA